MQVSAINFTGRRDNIDAFINLDDAAIRQSAALKTFNSIDTQKHKRLDNALTWGLPLAGGLSMAAELPKGFRGAGFATGVLDWGLFLAGAGLASKALAFVRDKVGAVKDFTEKHGFLSSIGMLAATIAGGIGLQQGGVKLISKALNSKTAENLIAKGSKIVDKFPKTKAFTLNAENAISKNISSLHPAIKSSVKWAAKLSPWALIIGSFAHSVNHAAVVNSTYCKNFNDMKEKQLELARQRNRELTLQNDFFLTDAQNREDAKVIA